MFVCFTIKSLGIVLIIVYCFFLSVFVFKHKNIKHETQEMIKKFLNKIKWFSKICDSGV